MKTVAPPIQECVDVLTKAFPIEDIWFLEAGKAKECGLERPSNLVVIVPDDSEAHQLEGKARTLLKSHEDVDVFVFPLMAMMRTPRPQLIKMAFSAGENIYSR